MTSSTLRSLEIGFSPPSTIGSGRRYSSPPCTPRAPGRRPQSLKRGFAGGVSCRHRRCRLTEAARTIRRADILSRQRQVGLPVFGFSCTSRSRMGPQSANGPAIKDKNWEARSCFESTGWIWVRPYQVNFPLAIHGVLRMRSPEAHHFGISPEAFLRLFNYCRALLGSINHCTAAIRPALCILLKHIMSEFPRGPGRWLMTAKAIPSVQLKLSTKIWRSPTRGCTLRIPCRSCSSNTIAIYEVYDPFHKSREVTA